ncbi:MAG TPA: WHG domain-containing protein [Beutenbergiaceae bacterium]|nr:WHG domain-containing protein [Beutenbergiaceae bacterium]
MVIETAAAMLDEQPGQDLSVAAVAARLGVRPPSLYKHVAGAAGLRRGVMLRAKRDLADVLGRAAMGKSREEGMAAIAQAYRRWAKDHPGQYPLTVRAPEPDDHADEEVSTALVNVLYAVLSGYGLDGDDLTDAARFLRSALHGFVDLETSAAFRLPRDLDRSFARVVRSLGTALKDWTRTSNGGGAAVGN